MHEIMKGIITALPPHITFEFQLDHNRRISYYLNKMLNQSISLKSV